MTLPDDSDAKSAPARARWPAWLPKALFEAALIVLSVLLALVVNEWREDQQQQQRAGVALQSIQAELRENLQSVRRARANHLAMQTSLRTLATRGQTPPPDIYLGGIFNPALVSASAWEAARESGMTEHLPYELVLALSRVYAEQARYQALSNGLVQDLMAQIRREGVETVLRDRSMHFLPIQEDFANREQHLAEAYERVLDELTAGLHEGFLQRGA